MRKLLLFSLVFSAVFLRAQQNEEFISAMKYFQFQRVMLKSAFEQRIKTERKPMVKAIIQRDMKDFMQKLDSVQNAALIGALIRVKNREDLERLKLLPANTETKGETGTEISRIAEYPGGTNNLRAQVASLIYTGAVLPTGKKIQTEVRFIVERDGKISSVEASGENFTFNRQAEIALYLLPERFRPAMEKGTAVRYHYRMPLTMTFE